MDPDRLKAELQASQTAVQGHSEFRIQPASSRFLAIGGHGESCCPPDQCHVLLQS